MRKKSRDNCISTKGRDSKTPLQHICVTFATFVTPKIAPSLDTFFASISIFF